MNTDEKMDMRRGFVPSPDEVYYLAEYSSFLYDGADILEYVDRVEPQQGLWGRIKKAHVIFLAGYIAGKREERARRKEAVV